MNYSKTSAGIADKIMALRILLGSSLAIVLNLVFATFFAMLLVACSENVESPINGAHGGSSEEPCVQQASLENISVKGLAKSQQASMSCQRKRASH